MSRRHDLMKLLSEARPGRLDPDPGPASIDLATITTHSQADLPRRASRRRLLLTAGLLPTAAMAAVAVAVVVGNQPVNNPRPGRSVAQAPATRVPTMQAPRTAREMLLTAAEQAERAEATSGRYWVRKTEDGSPHRVGSAGRQYIILDRGRMERWLATDPMDVNWNVLQRLGAVPATAADKAAWEADGSPAQWLGANLTTAAGPITVVPDPSVRPGRDGGKPTQPLLIEFGGMGVSVPELSALPMTPAALKAALLKMRDDKGSILVDDDDIFLYHSAAQLVFELPVNPQVRAAAYRVMAGLKGVTMLGATTDQQGRKGMAVAYTRRGDGGNLTQTRLIIDPLTGQALASESWDLGKRSSAAGKLVQYTLVISAGYTDDAPPKATPAGRKN